MIRAAAIARATRLRREAMVDAALGELVVWATAVMVASASVRFFEALIRISFILRVRRDPGSFALLPQIRERDARQ